MLAASSINKHGVTQRLATSPANFVNPFKSHEDLAGSVRKLNHAAARFCENQTNMYSGAFEMLKRFWRTFKRRLLIGASIFLLVSNVGILGFAELESGVFQVSYATAEKMRYTIWFLLIGLLNAETGARGYLITGDEIYLSPYSIGIQSVSDQLRVLRLLPLDEIERAEATELASLVNKQLAELANLVDQQRAQGRDTAGLRFKTGVDKVGLDTLRSFIDRTTGDIAASMVMLQHRSKDYLDVTVYCILFAAFWIYSIILLSARQRHGEEP
jgi:CHASE3 domain sensor protein